MVEVDWPISGRRFVQQQNPQGVKHQNRLPIVVHFAVSKIGLVRAGSKKKRVICYANSCWVPKNFDQSWFPKIMSLSRRVHNNKLLGWTKEAPQNVDSFDHWVTPRGRRCPLSCSFSFSTGAGQTVHSTYTNYRLRGRATPTQHQEYCSRRGP